MTLPPPTLSRCYRHPDRETGRSCTRCGRPACSSCLRQVSVGSQCVECLQKARPSAPTRLKWWNARQPMLVTLVLIGINAIIFLYGLRDPSGLSGRTITETERQLGLSRVFLAEGEWWRLITSGFLHFGVIHLAFNMFILFQLGRMLEPALGRVRFTLLYFASLLAGSAGAMLLQPDGLHGGASGAVFGLMAAAAVGLRSRGIGLFQTAIGPVLVLNLLITFTIPGLSIGGHLGGAVGGAICGFVLLAPPWKQMPAGLAAAVPVIVGLGSAALALAMSQA